MMSSQGAKQAEAAYKFRLLLDEGAYWWWNQWATGLMKEFPEDLPPACTSPASARRRRARWPRRCAAHCRSDPAVELAVDNIATDETTA